MVWNNIAIVLLKWVRCKKSVKYIIIKNQEFETRNLPADDAFHKSILQFVACVKDDAIRKENYNIIHRQESLIEHD